MAKKDPRVDAYIGKSAEFAKPILKHLRKLVHAAVPGVEETLKWSVPHFDYKGMMCSMASFKTHCAFGFWKGSLVLGENARREAAGHLGRIESIDDVEWITEAKADATRERRMARALEWIAQGKARNWKYS